MSDSRANSVLITRPQPRAAETASRVEALGFRPILAPVMRINHLDADLPEDAGAILLTSGNAVPSLPAWARNRPILAVGNATAALARQAGFPHVSSADGDSQALAEATRRLVPPDTPLLLLSGANQGTELAQTLTRAGWPVSRAEVYRTEPTAALPPEACAAIRGGLVHAALFFSARTADYFVILALTAGLRDSLSATDACAIGPPAAVALHRLPWRQICIAARPTQDALLALLP